MNASELTESEIQECIAYANEQGGWPPSNLDRDVHWHRAMSGNSEPWSVYARLKAREILLRKQQRDRAAEDIARAMQGLPPVQVAVMADADRALAPWLKVAGDGIDWGRIEAILVKKSRTPSAPAPAPFEFVVGCDYQHTTPDPTRAPLDAMLRFVCGHPQGVRWLGERDHADITRIARAFRPDRPVERKSCEPLASCLLTKLVKLPGTTLARWLGVDEQREYNRLYAALKAAVAQVRP